MSVPQLPLLLRPPRSAGLDDFLPAEAPALALLRGWLASPEGHLLLRGPPASGKTHLLLAALETLRQRARAVAYLPLATLGAAAGNMLRAQPAAAVVAVDDLDRVLDQPELQRALFALHNRVGDAGGGMLYACRGQPAEWDALLPDLRSRLGQAIQGLLVPLDETQRRLWFLRRVEALGMQMDPAALDYLFRRVGRDLPGLQRLIDRLDRDSLAAQRRLTVPFLRELLAAER